MSHDFPLEEEEPEEGENPCEGCTTDCSLCTYQTEIDKMLGIYSLRDSPDNFVREERLIPDTTQSKNPIPDLPPVAVPPQPSSNSDIQMEIIQPFSGDLITSNPINALSVVDSSLEPPLQRRRRGAPKGNTNAVKHGLYIDGKRLRNTTPIERLQLLDFNGIINHFKNYFEATYEKGMQAPTLYERIDTLRVLSMALMALTRTTSSLGEYFSTGLPSELTDLKKLTPKAIVDYFNKKVSAFKQASDPASELVQE